VTLAVSAFAACTAAAVHYANAGLSLSHYDARAHLVVARRILDSLTPGWQQIGAVWLPLPHVLNMLPVQVDAWYISGASAVGISILSGALAVWALASLVMRVTGSFFAAAAGSILLLANPNVLYLHSTPMTEPLFIASAFVAVELTARWVERGALSGPHAAGIALIAASMTRYEGWLTSAATVALAGIVLVRRGAPIGHAVVQTVRLGLYPAAAIILFSANSRWTIGTWFVPEGFFVPENPALGHPMLAWEQVRETLSLLSGTAVVWPAYAAAILIVLACIRTPSRGSLLLVLGLAAAAVLPWYAYVGGHPLRVRYAVPLIAACAFTTAAGIGLLWRPLRPLTAIAISIVAIAQTPPLDRSALLIGEAQRERQNQLGRAVVTGYLRAHHDGTTIMMSMGSLAHYMHDLARDGFTIHDFLHEGNDLAWDTAILGPRGFVRWVIVEEQAEGGDALFQAAKRDPSFLDGFERVAEGGGVALYRANSE
jgi:hypothetical protein